METMPNLTVRSGKSSRWEKYCMLCRSAIIVTALLSSAGPTHAQATIAEVKAVVKGTARLPCDIAPPVSNDSVFLVIWYKNDITPIYSFDVRGKHSEAPSHWKDKEILDERGYFLTVTDPATLSLNNVDERDEGEYRCRVDFRQSPTRNSRVRLTVITPPMNPTIFDDRGKEVPSVAGPYEEGREMKLLCVVSGGRPLPTVRWWRDTVLVDSTDEEYAHPGKVKHNQLIVPELKRSDLHAAYACEASNNNISQPVRASVSIEMHFKPLSASILSSNQPLSADRKYNIECQSVGSRPAAKITWWMDTKALDSSVEKTSSDGNITFSTLTFTPTVADHGKTLTCRAVNTLIDAAVEEDSWKLNVFFVPMLELKLGLSLNPDDIEEGDDVYFMCKVHANPWAYKVVWKHNSQTVQPNQKGGVIMSSQDLALQGVRRQQAGNYTCIASNVEGDGESNTVELRVMYKPICRPDQKRVYGVARHENAHVMCEVEAYPPPDSFKWSFNNTAETIDVPQARYKTSAAASGSSTSQSMLTYTPMTEMDYGTVMCWASNMAGQQKEPCVFHIIAAGHPEPPSNCTLLNQTTESLEVDCVEGFDGGQPQYFLLEVFDMQTGMLQANISSKFPAFSVSELGPGMVLKMLVYGANSKGKSEPVVVEGFTLKVAEKQTGTPVPFELNPVLGILIGVVAVLLVVAIVIVGALRVRAQNRGSPSRPGDLALKEKAALPLRSNVEDLYEMDDKNPDVIPCNKDSDYQLVSEAQTPGVNNQTPPELPSYDEHPKRNNVSRNGDLFENFKNNRDRYPPSGHPASDEVTYAELCLARPTSLQDPTLGGGNCKVGSGVVLSGGGMSSGIVRGREEPTIYAQIDHTRRPQPPPPLPQGCDTPQLTALSPLVSPVSCAPLSHPAMLHREIVTVRTPLMANQQESCV